MSTIRRVPCVLQGIANDDYRQRPGLSHSDAKRLRRSPWHFHALTLPSDAPAKTPTPQMVNGTLVHCALLEPDAFALRYVVAPDISKNSNGYKAFAHECIARGLEPISQLQHDQAHAQAAALRAHPEVARLMRAGSAEVSAWWECPRTEVLCKCRPDWVSEGWGDSRRGVILLDVKTTADAGRDAFARSVSNFGYHTQADWYCEGYALASGRPVLGMVFAVVESEYPHACAAFMLDDDALARARADNDHARRIYRECMAADKWPGYPQAIQLLSLPRFHQDAATEVAA